MLESDDVAAIQTYLKNTSSQVSAAVDTCASLDSATRDSWYALARRIVSYVSQGPGASLSTGRGLRMELRSRMLTLHAKGCGNLERLIAQAPPPTEAPPPQGTPNPWLTMFSGPIVPIVLVVLVAAWLRRR